MTASYKRRMGMVLAIAGVLLIPFLAMQFTEEVAWSIGDFVLMGGLLVSMAVAFELVVLRSPKKTYRVAAGIGLIAVFLLFWINGAVGIIGSENQPANLLYAAVFIVGLGGAFLSRLQARGMARVMWVMAVVQLITPLLAWLIWPQLSWGGAGVVGVLLLNMFFVLLFAVAGWLFERAR